MTENFGEGQGSIDQSARAKTDANLKALVAYSSRERYGTPMLKMGETAEVPTSRGTVTFLNESDSWRTDRDLDDYNISLFSGEYREGDPIPGAKRKAVLRTDGAEVLAGGRTHFFEDGEVFVDLGSGVGVALIQSYLENRFKNPNAKFIGVDRGYQDTQALDLHEPGVQLIADDWATLDKFPPNSVDRFSSVQGAFTWNIGKKNDFMRLPDEDEAILTATAADVAQAITRVAKTGAILRFDCEEEEREGNEAIIELKRLGWDIKFEPNTAVAVKTG